MVKLKITILGLLISSLAFSQVGINEENPQATLEIKSTGNTENTQSLLIKNRDNRESLRVLDSGKVGIGITDPTEILDINGNMRIRGINTNVSSTINKIVVTDSDGVLRVKPTPPPNQSGNINQGEPFHTGVSSLLYAPVMITYIPRNSAAGYYFTVEEDKWVLNIVNLANFSTGQIMAFYEILWINR